MVKVELTFHSETHVTYTPDEDDKWGRECTYTERDLFELFLVEDHSEICGYTLEIDEEIVEGDEIYVLFAEYSTGDSFGDDERWGFWFVEASRDHIFLEVIKDKLQKGKTVITNRTGKKYNVQIPWAGYFGNLDELHLMKLKVRK